MQNRYLSIFVGQRYDHNGYENIHRVVDLDTGEFATDEMLEDSSIRVAEGMNARIYGASEAVEVSNQSAMCRSIILKRDVVRVDKTADEKRTVLVMRGGDEFAVFGTPEDVAKLLGWNLTGEQHAD